MIEEPREAARTRYTVLLISAIAWALLVLTPDGGMLTHCPAAASGAIWPVPSLWKLLAMSLSMCAPVSLMAGWALMLAAMMSPALIQPVRHIQLRSFVRRRARLVTLFVLGYTAVWMGIGCVLLGLQLVIAIIAPQSWLPAVVVVLLAVVWQCSPIKQRCLNRCHAHLELAAFGPAADFGALRFGVVHCLWCAGSCWVLMFASMLLPRWHIAAMAIAAVLIGCERLERPQQPCWRPRGLGKVTRIVRARAREHLKAFRLSVRSVSSGDRL